MFKHSDDIMFKLNAAHGKQRYFCTGLSNDFCVVTYIIKTNNIQILV